MQRPSFPPPTGWRTLSALSILLLSACAHIPPEHERLAQLDATQLALPSDIRLAQDSWPQPQWWLDYRDPQLNQLVAQALAHNPGMELAATRIAAADAALAFSGADRDISAGLNANSNRQLYSANGLFPAPIGGNYFNETAISAQARYDFDWWGKHKAQIAAALGEVRARQADYAQARQVLSAAVVQSYIRLQSKRALIAQLQQLLNTQNAQLADVRQRIAHGLASVAEQRQPQIELSMLQQQLTQLQSMAANEREALRALLAADSQALQDLQTRTLPALPATLPNQLGLALLARRADLQAARYRVEAALSRVEVAQSAFYPEINLAASVGLDTLSLSNLLNSGSITSYIGPSLSLPLFDSKRLQARLGAARSERDTVIADYNQSVLNAVRDVAQQAIAVRGLHEQVAQEAQASQVSAQWRQEVQRKYQHGMTDHRTLLTVEMSDLKQGEQRLQLQEQALLAQVALFKALGGGYHQSADETGSSTLSAANQ